MKKIRYFYYFRGTLKAHVHFYKCWVDAARSVGLPMEMTTMLRLKKYVKQYKLVKKYKTSYFHIFPSLDEDLFAFIYFFGVCLRNDKVIIHLKKRSPYLFDKLKKIFPEKIKYIIDLEGDPYAEQDYLLKHPYKKGFYDSNIDAMERNMSSQRELLKNADHALVVAPELKEVLIERYPDLNLREKISVLPMSFTKDSLYFSEEVRSEYRKRFNLEGRFVVTYIGNAYYSWQNVFRTIEMFKMIKEQIERNAFLLLLVKKQDHDIVKEFIEKLDLSNSDYLLSYVDYEEIPKYLSASDLGVLLRHKHLMNKVVTSGKIVDYLGCGLPVITTDAISKFPKKLRQKNYGIVLKDMDDDDEILRKIVPFLKYDKEKRAEISEWAKCEFSTEAYAQTYVDILNKL